MHWKWPHSVIKPCLQRAALLQSAQMFPSSVLPTAQWKKPKENASTPSHARESITIWEGSEIA